MAFGEVGHHQWSVYDAAKLKKKKGFLPLPEALMAEINSAISSLEYARTTAFLDRATGKSSSRKYDARKAEEVYKAARAAMDAGKLDEAIHELNIALSSCPPEETNAVDKIQSLIINITSQRQLRKTSAFT